MSIGIANPTPLLDCVSVAICALMPITEPCASSSGPPELPGLMAASVCSAPEIWKPLGDWIGRPSAEMTPVVSDPCSPNGEPMATAGWPTCTDPEEPSASGFRPPSTPAGSTFSTARSLDASVPATFAEMRSSLSPMRTRTVSAPATTWSFVRM